MKIDRIELFHVAFPLDKPFHPAWIPGYPQTVNRFTLARLTTDDGIRGLAAGAAFNREREGLERRIGIDQLEIALERRARLREIRRRQGMQIRGGALVIYAGEARVGAADVTDQQGAVGQGLISYQQGHHHGSRHTARVGIA